MDILILRVGIVNAVTKPVMNNMITETGRKNKMRINAEISFDIDTGENKYLVADQVRVWLKALLGVGKDVNAIDILAKDLGIPEAAIMHNVSVVTGGK